MRPAPFFKADRPWSYEQEVCPSEGIIKLEEREVIRSSELGSSGARVTIFTLRQ